MTILLTSILLSLFCIFKKYDIPFNSILLPKCVRLVFEICVLINFFDLVYNNNTLFSLS